MLSVIEYDSRYNLQFAEFHCAKPDKRGNRWIYPIAKVADGKAKYATKREQEIAREWVESKLR